jgi:DNA-binding NtrC family response regulator
MDREAIQKRFGIVGSSPALKHVIDRVRHVAPTELTVTIEGESGVGKELIAQAIHQMSSRRHERLVVVNCGAIPEGLIESELFGNVKGAYTGAVEQRAGHFEEADGGTLFLDEIGEMPQQAQVRLLRVLENGEFSRVGSSEKQTVDVRIIAATNKNLADEVGAGRFREDLYYRISTVVIDIPPLRDRPEDILPIFKHFLHDAARKYDAPMKRLDNSAIDLLERYRWPGNVRELQNVAEQAEVMINQRELTADDLQPFLRGVTASDSTALTVTQAADSQAEDGPGTADLLYRFLIDLRMEMRELRSLVQAMAVQMDISPSGGMGREGRPETAPERLLPTGEHAYDVGPRDEPSSSSEPREYPGGRADASDSFGDGVFYEIEEEEGDPEDQLPTIEEAERSLIEEALEHFDGNRRKTAEALGISERTLYRKLKQMENEEVS